MHLADAAVRAMIAIKKRSAKLKDMSITMPNAPYSIRSTRVIKP